MERVSEGQHVQGARRGDRVRIRSRAEIMDTLDEQGALAGLPFMPEMLEHCGTEVTVYSRADKTCDTIDMTGATRAMDSTVHLAGLRCDGSAHGGCQAACLIFWKHAWLRKVDRAEPAGPGPVAQQGEERLLPLLTIASRGPAAEDGAAVYRCQATELLGAAPDQLPMRNLGQYVDDVRTGNVGVLWTVRAFLVLLYNRVQGRTNRYLPDRLRIRDGRDWGFPRGRAVGRTPTGTTGLQPGDTVRIKSRKEIELTLNRELLNRGMGFDAEMARFCGRTARVARRVDQIIDERTGRMLHMKNPCLVLEGIVCEGAYNASCPRAIPPYWREVWLDRVATAPTGQRIPAQRTRSHDSAEGVIG